MRDEKPNGGAGHHPATVLVVDDELALGRVLRRVLDDHEVTVVASASEALDLVASGKAFDVILSDLMMPEMSGMDLYDELTKQLPEAAERMVFMTGTAFIPAVQQFLARVPNERIEKPFALGAVRSVVEKVAARSTSRNSCRVDAISDEYATEVE
jgi:CheY-like chemotaxis protein